MPSISLRTPKDISSLEFTKPILVIGKGPSYSKRFNVEQSLYHTIGINNVDGCEYNHIIDWNCMDYTKNNIIAPFYPLLDGAPYLTLMPPRHNTYFYNFQTAKEKHGDTPIITNDSFSIHCVIEILHYKGIRKFWSCGIDGGAEYHKPFQGTPTPRPSGYDDQWRGIQERLDKFKMEMIKL